MGIMKIALVVLAVAVLSLAAAQEAPRGRERLRELVQKARAGDVEAQTLLASRRRKVVRNRVGGGAAREQSAVAQILAGGAATASATPARLPSVRNRQRGSSVSSRSRSRGGSAAAEVTTFRPAFPAAAPATEAPAPIELSPVPINAVEPLPEAAVNDLTLSEPADLTPTNVIPSLFQPAQFGSGGVGVQAQQSIRRPAPAPQPSRPSSRVSSQPSRIASQPHRAIQRGLETGTRAEFIEPSADPERPATPPPVQTTRRYSYFDEAGNYVFGYEAEDGSFKEEVRGKDCIVNGKYGYVDPDGIRREFTYTSGNKCDPNNPDALLDANVPLNDQFLHQTQAQALTDAELSALKFNRRRQPTAAQPRQETVAQQPRQRTSSSRRLTARPASRPQPRPAPEPVQRVAPAPRPKPAEVKPVDLTPTSVVPNLFKPAQFGSDGRGVAPKPDEERFPVPDFLSQSSRPREERPAPPPPAPREEPARAAAEADLTPTNVVPSLFQPAQFGKGGVGVQAQQTVRRPEAPARAAQPAPLPPPPPPPSRPAPRPANSFNFDQEFRSVFSHFENRPPVTFTAATPRPPPPPTRAPPPPPPTRPPPPPPTRPPPPSSNTIPSLFRPAQFNTQPEAPRPAPPPAPKPARPPIDDNALTLTAQRPSGAPQLVFDASTGTFKTIHVQSNNHFRAPGVQSAPSAPPPRPPPPPPPAPSRPPPPPAPIQRSFQPSGGRPLTQVLSHNSGSRSPLPPIPTSAAEFDSFFAQFPTSG